MLVPAQGLGLACLYMGTFCSRQIGATSVSASRRASRRSVGVYALVGCSRGLFSGDARSTRPTACGALPAWAHGGRPTGQPGAAGAGCRCGCLLPLRHALPMQAHLLQLRRKRDIHKTIHAKSLCCSRHAQTFRTSLGIIIIRD